MGLVLFNSCCYTEVFCRGLGSWFGYGKAIVVPCLCPLSCLQEVAQHGIRNGDFNHVPMKELFLLESYVSYRALREWFVLPTWTSRPPHEGALVYP